MEDVECLEYKPGRIYRLSAPSDGQGQDGVIARYPVGLPVMLVEKSHDLFIVREPHGKLTSFPLRMVWRMGEDVDIFEEGVKGDGELLLQEFPSEEDAERIWGLYVNPEQNRHYVDNLRQEMKDTVYSDWECGHSAQGISHILSVARLLLTIGDYEPVYSQEVTNAICDIALLIFEGDMPGWCEEVSPDEAEQVAYHVVNTILQLMDHSYFVKTRGTWDLKDRAFNLPGR